MQVRQSIRDNLVFRMKAPAMSRDRVRRMLDIYLMDGKLGPEVKVGKKVKIFLKVGSFKFNKKGKFKEREQIEIRRTSHNIFDGFNNISKNIV